MSKDTLITVTNKNRDRVSKDIRFIPTFLYALDRATRENTDLAYVQIEEKGVARSIDLVKQWEYDDLFSTKTGEYILAYNAENRILTVDISPESDEMANGSVSRPVIVRFNGPILTRYMQLDRYGWVNVQYADSLFYILVSRNNQTSSVLIRFVWSDPKEISIDECESDLHRLIDKTTDFDALVSDFEACIKRAKAAAE